MHIFFFGEEKGNPLLWRIRGREESSSYDSPRAESLSYHGDQRALTEPRLCGPSDSRLDRPGCTDRVVVFSFNVCRIKEALDFSRACRTFSVLTGISFGFFI
ncbi:hypothetical protein EVAR_23394_1 [Eumeta japonica]|uniref:Uncharacterized protein n=1 Tax=Eumeta variegata TaxID=151549 RepID=A0A4C1VUA9_EUMVA|nr:hypothetical protein EVAR_23394_1 [Eumeta japonica]